MASLRDMPDEPEFLNRTEAAALLRVSPRTLDRWVKLGRVPAGRTPGGAPRFRRAELVDLVATEHQQSPPPTPSSLL